MKIFVIGGVSYDTLIHVGFLPEPQSQTIFSKRTIESIGSTGAGKVMPLAKLGLEVSFHALIGEDQKGEQIKKRLINEHIDFFYDIDPKGTETHTNIMDDLGKRISIYTQASTFEPTVDDQAIEAAILNADIIVMNIINYTRRFIPFVKAQHKPLWIDLHDYDGKSAYHQDYVDAADIIFMSKDALTSVQPFVDNLLKQGKEAVIITDGPNGVTGYYQKESIHIPALKPRKTGDFNGAGDHLFSGYLFGYLNHYSRKECLKAGVELVTACIESDDISNDIITSDWLKNRLKNAA